MIRPYYFDLHIIQLVKEFSTLDENQYDTRKLDEYVEDLRKLLDYVSKYDYSKIPDPEKIGLRDALNLLSHSIAYLQTTTKEDLTSEMFSCLRLVLKDWIPTEADKYVIVCSQGDYSILRNEYLDPAYEHVEKFYKIPFRRKLISINTPLYRKSDFLFNSVLYHEIGHFVDNYYHITDRMMQQFVHGVKRVPQQSEYFKGIDFSTPGNTNWNRVYSYLREYFADIFASQYIGKTVYTYLLYVNPIGDGTETHPSSANRIKIVDDFVDNNTANIELLECIKEATRLTSKKVLERRYEDIDITPFLSLNIASPTSPKQLHNIFQQIWDLWINQRNNFIKVNELPLSNAEIYQHINNLTAATIQRIV